MSAPCATAVSRGSSATSPTRGIRGRRWRSSTTRSPWVHRVPGSTGRLCSSPSAGAALIWSPKRRTGCFVRVQIVARTSRCARLRPRRLTTARVERGHQRQPRPHWRRRRLVARSLHTTPRQLERDNRKRNRLSERTTDFAWLRGVTSCTRPSRLSPHSPVPAAARPAGPAVLVGPAGRRYRYWPVLTLSMDLPGSVPLEMRVRT